MSKCPVWTFTSHMGCPRTVARQTANVVAGDAACHLHFLQGFQERFADERQAADLPPVERKLLRVGPVAGVVGKGVQVRIMLVRTDLLEQGEIDLSAHGTTRRAFGIGGVVVEAIRN